jgi:signal transduction histidine kinase
VDGPPDELTSPRPWFWIWDAYIFLVYGVSLVTTLDEGQWSVGRRLGAAGSLTCLVLWYALFGRRVVRSGDDGPRAYAFVAGVLVLFGAELMFVPTNSIVLFALFPMIFMAIPLRMAIGGVVLASVLPAAVLSRTVGLAGGSWHNQLAVPLIGMAVSTLMGTFIVRTTNLSDQRAELIEQLRASQAEVARLSHEAGMAAERGRLAREIHDTLAQGFTSIVTLVQAAESELDGELPEARGHLALAARTARENLAEARALVAALTPSALDSGSLEDAVRRQVERLDEETTITATYRTVGEPAELPTAVQVVLLRAVQEALANVRKHSRATNVTVTLRFAEGTVALSVVDDGVGISAQEGFGLRGMRARAEQVSGTLVVNGLPGKGTRLELEVPR